MNGRHWLVIAALMGGSGVGLGAYHAHGLERRLTKCGVEGAALAKRLTNCETGIRYQMYHALALLAVAPLAARDGRRCWRLAVGGFVLGVALFSGGLYLFVFTGHLGHWAIVPSGGLVLLVAWGLTAFAVATAKLPNS